MLAAVRERLEGPHGVAMLDPPYTGMREDIGRLTQKHPGSAENGSVYNHAAAFWVQALFRVRRPEDAFRVLRLMIPGPETAEYVQRGQLPAFLPNYYRGDWRRRPRTAGRSSQLVNTGTVAWFYRIVVESLFGLRGCTEGLRVDPQLPAAWAEARVERRFRGADFECSFIRMPQRREVRVQVDGQALEVPVIGNIEPGRTYRVNVELPESAP
jgi:cellobionic acid phosphorylase